VLCISTASRNSTRPSVPGRGEPSRDLLGAPSPVRRLGSMQLEITDEAAALLTKRGGTMAIDFIRPTG